jgi:hypothetical protein
MSRRAICQINWRFHHRLPNMAMGVAGCSLWGFMKYSTTISNLQNEKIITQYPPVLSAPGLWGVSKRRRDVCPTNHHEDPDISRVKWSKAQKERRERFGEAVCYAKTAMADPRRVHIMRRSLRRQAGVLSIWRSPITSKGGTFYQRNKPVRLTKALRDLTHPHALAGSVTLRFPT